MIKYAAAAVLLLMAMASPGLANDSTAELGAGGIELVRNDVVTMLNEDLYLSPDAVRVDYVFESAAENDRDYLMAFPMPDISPKFYLEGDVGIPDTTQDNFLGFTVTADGKAITPKLDSRAISYGIDVTDDLKTLGIPLFPFAEATQKAVSALPPDKARTLQDRGILSSDYEPNTYRPAWTLRSAYYWTQHFPAKAKVAISHRYTPAIGGFFLGADTLDGVDAKTYCYDAAFKAAVAKQSKTSNGYMLARSLAYILVTANNWAENVHDFHLTIDKKTPERLVSTCIEGLKKTGLAQFELRRTDYAPDADLAILFIEAMPK
ncbi:DUF4424 domain-containing protein [soil metagenome]